MRNLQTTLLFNWFDKVWNNGDENAIDELMTHDSKANGIIPDNEPQGAAGFKIFYNNFKTQFHDIKIDVGDVIGEDDIEAARTTVSAVHTASGKPVTFSGICMVKVANGKIAEAWNNYDFLNLYEQLGQKLTSAV